MISESPIIRMTAAMRGIPPGVSGLISVWASRHPPENRTPHLFSGAAGIYPGIHSAVETVKHQKDPEQ